MRSGRRSKTYIGTGNQWPGSGDNVGNVSAPARNLQKSELAGVIFGCKHHTISECLTKLLFGLPGPHISYVKNIEPGLPLFLFNYSDRKLYAIYESASHGQMNLDPYGWTNGGKERTSYPAQVRIRIKSYCQPVTERQFKSFIDDNYYTPRHFFFELDRTQLKGLLSLFTPTCLVENTSLKFGPSSSSNLLRILPTERKKAERLADATVSNVWNISTRDDMKNQCLIPDLLKENRYLTLVSEGASEHGNQNENPCSSTEGDNKEPASDWEDLVSDDGAVGPSNDSGHSTEEGKTLELNVDENQEILEERELNRLKNLALECNSLNQLSNDSQDKSDDSITPLVSGIPDEVGKQVPEVPEVSLLASRATVINLIQMVKELQGRTTVLEKKQTESEEELQQLRNFTRESSRKLQRLTEQVKELESRADPSMTFVEDSLNKSLLERYLGSENLVYLIGGFDGNSWLSDLDSYSPVLDMMTPLCPMASVRPHASATALNDRLYVFGGGAGCSWYDTVECYDPRNDKWMTYPSLVRVKENLAGATLDGKIFAIGGCNGQEIFSDVEVFNPTLGRWINGQSMLQKRSALAAVELNGALYAVGGFDSSNCLKSAERFDPREGLWTRISSMNVPRCAHSMTVLNEKLYIMGGHDGSEVLGSVEVFDPRVNTWVIGEPMRKIRGHAAAAVLGDSLYILGGLSVEGTLVDTVECYREDAGWMNTGLKAVGKRCFFSALVL